MTARTQASEKREWGVRFPARAPIRAKSGVSLSADERHARLVAGNPLNGPGAVVVTRVVTTTPWVGAP